MAGRGGVRTIAGAAALLLGLCLSVQAGDRAVGAWLAEWDFSSGRGEAAFLAGRLDSLRLFAAYFDESDKPFLAEGLRNGQAPDGFAGADGPAVFITFVNDVVGNDGTSSLKDRAFVERVLSDPAASARHRRDLIDFAKSLPFPVDGLELDYERIGADNWARFLDFCRALHDDCLAAGLSMRVVMEPRAHCLAAPLPPGPEYSVMAYNLHGSHNGPGPKTDPSLVARIASWCRRGGVTPFPALALPTGGFFWRAGGRVEGLREIDAAALAAKSAATVRRHDYSRYLYFANAEGDDGGEVWYADAETFRHMARIAREHGFDKIDVWRLGGNSDDALKAFAEAGRAP